ncbi:MAG: hypothetical protein HYZ12_06590 [Thaumarchaeota archaeon]|nr:hypothetical protein [Nitrososphaerota archaeon]
MGKRARIVFPLLGSILLIFSLFLPWWSATARLPDGIGSAQLTLYSFQFESSSFSCTTILLFYSYGTCPILGSGNGAAMLAFYLFWTLLFLTLSFCLGMVSAVVAVKEYARQFGWLPVASPVLNTFGNLSFVAAISTAGMKFVSGSALYGSSEVLEWTVSLGFILAITSTLVQFGHAYHERRTG